MSAGKRCISVKASCVPSGARPWGSVLRCGHGFMTTRCESRTPWLSFQTDALTLPRLWWTLMFPEPEAEDRRDDPAVRGQLHHEGKDREALLHPPSRQESEAARGGLSSPFSFPPHGVSQAVELR